MRKFVLFSAILTLFLSVQRVRAEDDPNLASTSEIVQSEGLRYIPKDKLQDSDKKLLASVVENIDIFRRLPTKSVVSDHDLYRFSLENPDLIVAIWQKMGIKKITITQDDEGWFNFTEGTASKGRFKFLHQSANLHVLYGEGKYSPKWMLTPISGKFVVVLRSGYWIDDKKKKCIISRLYAYGSLPLGGGNLLATTLKPAYFPIMDENFKQCVAFVARLGDTAKRNAEGMAELIESLDEVSEVKREKMTQITSDLAKTASPAGNYAKLAKYAKEKPQTK